MPESQADRTPIEQSTKLATARLEELEHLERARRIMSASSDKSDPFIQTFKTEIKDVLPVHRFQASGKSPISEISVDDQNILSLEGLAVGKVTEVREVQRTCRPSERHTRLDGSLVNGLRDFDRDCGLATTSCRQGVVSQWRKQRAGLRADCVH